ncbi:unnamed protein product [Rangifer tarandus platyrhynchus]|uniref:Uncharacterized protein n=1 Tax=Rangifer tarandus platyrhynchus TaxID=3082113 RepID=A0ABN8Z143_RANTA|nr:unnamed protein product [Rangifer tarandus platyrhynchus]
MPAPTVRAVLIASWALDVSIRLRGGEAGPVPGEPGHLRGREHPAERRRGQPCPQKQGPALPRPRVQGDLWSGFPPVSRQGTTDTSRHSWLSRLDVLSPSGWRPGRWADTPRHPTAPGVAPATRGPGPGARSDPPATPPQETDKQAPRWGFTNFISRLFTFVLFPAGNVPVTCLCWETPWCATINTQTPKRPPARTPPPPPTRQSRDRLPVPPDLPPPLASEHTRSPTPCHRQTVLLGPRLVQTEVPQPGGLR